METAYIGDGGVFTQPVDKRCGILRSDRDDAEPLPVEVGEREYLVAVFEQGDGLCRESAYEEARLGAVQLLGQGIGLDRRPGV